jgi:hypothetical protein
MPALFQTAGTSSISLGYTSKPFVQQILSLAGASYSAWEKDFLVDPWRLTVGTSYGSTLVASKGVLTDKLTDATTFTAGISYSVGLDTVARHMGLFQK